MAPQGNGPEGPHARPRYTVAFETFGCRLNQAETALFARAFMDRGYRWVERTDAADLCVIHTCALTAHATAKCRRLIRSIARRNPDACIAAVGCYAQTGVDALRRIEGLDFIVGTSDKMRLADIIPAPVKLPEPHVVISKAPRHGFTIDGVGYYPLHTRANLKVQEGCNFVCAFCIIPRSRGPARSRGFDDIVREARALADAGHRELVMTGVNIGTYRDGGKTLADVVDALCDIDGLDRIRLSSIEPTTIEPRLVAAMARGTKLCAYLHVPLQSGDDGVLARMRRKYTAAEYVAFIEDALARVPHLGLGTDVIVGFPGEDDRAFEATCRLVERLPFNNVHVFSFSAREGTGASRLPGRVPGPVVARRSRTMHAIAAARRQTFYRQQSGTRTRVLFEERDAAGRYVGFSDNYVKTAVATTRDLANRLEPVRITDVSAPERHRPPTALGELIAAHAAEGAADRAAGAVPGGQR